MQDPLDQRKKSAGKAFRLIGIVLLVLVLICGGLIAYIAYNFRTWMADAARGPLVQSIQGSHLPEAQKEVIVRDINRLSDAIESGELSYTQVGSVFEKLSRGRFFDLVTVETIRAEYIEQMSPDEAAPQGQAMISFDRFQRGIAQEDISNDEVAEVMSIVSNEEDGVREPKQDLTKTELEAFVEAMRKQADAAGVPDEPYQVDFAGEFNQAVEAVLGPDNELTDDEQIEDDEQTDELEGPATRPADTQLNDE